MIARLKVAVEFDAAERGVVEGKEVVLVGVYIWYVDGAVL